MMDSKFYKCCAVPQCENTSVKTPAKLFIYVPSDESIRKTWLELAGRNPAELSKKTRLYFCEDHFDLPNDMRNYMEYHIMGSVSQIRLKPDSLPSKFECQPDRKNKTSVNVTRPLVYERKLEQPKAVTIEQIQKVTLKDDLPRIIANNSPDTQALKKMCKNNLYKIMYPTSKAILPLGTDLPGYVTSTTSEIVNDHIRKQLYMTSRFPKDWELQNKWKEACGKEKLNLINARVCSDHFSPDCFRKKPEHLIVPGDKNIFRLSKNAVPTENLAEKPNKRSSWPVPGEEHFCRVCLKRPAKNSFLPLSLVDENHRHTTDPSKTQKTEQIKYCQEVLRLVIPDFDYSIIFNPIICMSCHTKLVTAYSFFKEYQTNEKLIKQYKERYASTKDYITIDEVVKSKNQLVREGLLDSEQAYSRKRKREWDCEHNDEQQSEIKVEPVFVDIDEFRCARIDEECLEKASGEKDERVSFLQSSECKLNEDGREVKIEREFEEEMVTVKEEFNCEEFPTADILTPCQDQSNSPGKVKLENTTEEIDSNITNYYDMVDLEQYPQNLHWPFSRTYCSVTNISTTNQLSQRKTFDDKS